MKKYIFSIILIQCCVSLFSQPIENSFQAFIEKGDNLGLAFMHFDLEKYDTLFWPLAVAALNETKGKNRGKFYGLLLSIGLKSKNSNIRNQAVKYLIQACNEPIYSIREFYGKTLFKFEKRAFTEEDRIAIAKILHDPTKVTRHIILLIGYLGLREQKKYLWSEFVGTYVQKPTQENTRFYYHSEEWIAYLALARMGDKKALKLILQRFQEEQSNSNKCVFLVEDLAYTRQKQAFKALIGVLIEDIKTIPKYELSTPCGAYIVSALVKGLKNYPRNIPSSYFMESKEQVIKWFRNHQKLVIDKDTF